MITNFNEQLATDLNEIEVPVFIENLAYWIRKNAANEKHLHEGRYWSYNSYPAFRKLYPFWSEQTIRRIIKRAVKADLLIIGNFNKKKFDNTNWYTLTDKALAYFPALSGLVLYTPVEIDRRSVEIDRPIPKDLTTSNIINNITSKPSSSKEKPQKSKALMEEMIAAYRDEFPDNPQPHPKVISTSLQKTMQTLIKRWPELDPGGNPLDINAFRRYLNLLRTTAPKFSLGEYVTEDGNRKKNNLETFCRWNTIVKFLESAYT
jgi:hypothetical protein